MADPRRVCDNRGRDDLPAILSRMSRGDGKDGFIV
jgi:hypothetical protein